MLTLFLHAQFFKIKKFYFLFFVILQIIFTNSVFADVPMPNSVRQISLEATHTCALTTDDNLWCWGNLICYDGKNNPSIICNATEPNCCEDSLFGFISTGCRDEIGYGLYVCSGESADSNVTCEVDITYIPSYTRQLPKRLL